MFVSSIQLHILPSASVCVVVRSSAANLSPSYPLPSYAGTSLVSSLLVGLSKVSQTGNFIRASPFSLCGPVTSLAASPTEDSTIGPTPYPLMGLTVARLQAQLCIRFTGLTVGLTTGSTLYPTTNLGNITSTSHLTIITKLIAPKDVNLQTTLSVPISTNCNV